MSTALAIAATTRVISTVIDRHVLDANVSVLGFPQTSSLPPDRIATGDTEPTQLNLFLFHVTFNQGWRQVGLPSRNGTGESVDRPPLALDLHYMLSAYGAQEYPAQMLLGLGMQALHETPVLERGRITNVFTTPPPAPNSVDAALATAGIAEQFELIKISPEPMGNEDLSKLWTAFGGKFRPSAAYVVTVVLIESTTQVRPALPVLRRNLAVVQLREPHVTAVEPQVVPWSSAARIVLTGDNLSGDALVVQFDGNPGALQTPDTLTSGAQIAVTLPPLPAGINTLRVVRQLALGAPPVHTIAESNVALFFLQPVIRRDPNPPHDDLIVVDGINHTITVQLDPVVASTQRVQLLLNELSPPPPGQVPASYTFDARPDQIAPNAVTFTTSGTRSGPHLLRVRVDGAESALRTDPVTQAFAAPEVSL